jgi:hypothetical protein
MQSIWLFWFVSYSYCQGTRDKHWGDMRLLHMTLPCEEWEARGYLEKTLKANNIEYDKNSIRALNVKITNS